MNIDNSSTKKDLTVSAIQFEPKFKEKKRNLEKIENLIRESASKGARLIVTPEMATTGYIWSNRNEIKPFVETIPGNTTDIMCKIANELDVYIVIGLAEVDKDTDDYFNTAVLIGPEGIIGRYRKVHPYMAEPLWAKNGNEGFKVFNTEIGRIGLAICMDLTFFESSRVLQLKECDIICAPVNWFGELAPSILWITRAFETGCPVIVANRWDKERKTSFAGCSTILDHQGKILALKDRGDGVILADLNIDEIRKHKKTMGKRQKYSFYNELSLSTHRWNPLGFFSQTSDGLPKGDIFKSSAIQVSTSIVSDMEKRINYAVEIIEKEAYNGSKLVVFPELYLSGIAIISKDEAKSLSISSEEIDTSLNKILETCNSHNIYVVIGGIEYKDEKLYNAAWLLGANGLMGSYYKIELNNQEKLWAEPGNDLFVCDLPIGRLAIILGEELKIPEFARIAAIRGADILAVPSAINNEYVRRINVFNDELIWHMARVRAREHNLYTIFSNYSDNGYVGESGVFGPDAGLIEGDEAIISSDQKTGIINFEINTENLNPEVAINRVRSKQLLVLREPYWYTELI